MTEQKPSFRRQSITLAVAAAVFALSGTAWGADYNRITTTNRGFVGRRLGDLYGGHLPG